MNERPQVDTGHIVERAMKAQPQDIKARRQRWIAPLGAIVALVALVLAMSALFQDRDQARGDATQARGDANTNGAAAVDLSDQVLSACRTGGKAAAELRARGLCSSAVSTKKIIVAGQRGDTGPQGNPGPAGASGTAGAAGVSGAAGARGIPGAAGSPGAQGARGADGATGAQGPKGDTGAQGATGDRGAPGDTGPAGRDAYPFTFTFTVPGSIGSGDTTYTCTVTSPADQGTCTPSS